MTFTGNQAIMFFILHLLGDYVIQTDWMAKNKRTDLVAAALHAFVYSFPFMVYFLCSWQAAMLIFVSHLLIDHYGLARYVVFAKNWVTDWSLNWKDCDKTGYPNDTPPWLSVWLLILADNTLHLIFNYVALVYL